MNFTCSWGNNKRITTPRVLVRRLLAFHPGSAVGKINRLPQTLTVGEGRRSAEGRGEEGGGGGQVVEGGGNERLVVCLSASMSAIQNTVERVRAAHWLTLPRAEMAATVTCQCRSQDGDFNKQIRVHVRSQARS